MGRRDWQETDVSRAWRTILMGQRPPSVQWPRSWEKRGRSSSAVHSKIQHSAPKPSQPSRGTPSDRSKPSDRQPRGSPDDVAEAQARVIRLQAAVDLLGEDNPDAAGLKTMLAEAKVQTRVAPVGERLDACLKFIERAKKRLESAEQDVIKAQEARVARETELSEGLANLQRLRSEATSAVPSPPVGGVADPAEEIRRLRAHIALLESGSTDTSREVMRQKKAKTLNAPSPDLANMECTQLASPEEVPVPRDPSTVMSTLINEADSALKSARPPVP